jgi:uncharacterized protein YkwD
MKHTKQTLTLLSVAILAGCGGGGGSGSGGSTGGTSTIVTSVPAATYAAGSQEKAAYDYLNAERAKCGFGLLAQNSMLDIAATAHANYLVANNTLGHNETNGAVGFTGASISDRVVATGYTQGTGTWFAGEDYSQNAGSGLEATKYLLAAPYHLASLVDGFFDVGMGYKASMSSQTVMNVFNFVLGVPKNKGAKQVPITGTILTYPCQDVSGIKPSFANELQNWTGGPVGAGAGGTPTVVVAPNGETIAINSASYSPLSGGGAVTVSVLAANNDPNHLISTSSALIIPPASLAANTTYRVQLTGTAAGVAFTKDFNFMTGN